MERFSAQVEEPQAQAKLAREAQEQEQRVREDAIKKVEAETLGQAKERAKQLGELIRAKTNEVVRKKRKCEVVEVKDEGTKEDPGGPAASGEACGKEGPAGAPRRQEPRGSAAAAAANAPEGARAACHGIDPKLKQNLAKCTAETRANFEAASRAAGAPPGTKGGCPGQAPPRG